MVGYELKSEFHFWTELLDSLTMEQRKIVTRPRSYLCGNPLTIGAHTKVYSGASRVVLVDDRCDWVLKIDGCEANYTEFEVLYYSAAVAQGIDQCFVPAYDCGMYKRDWVCLPILLFKKCKCGMRNFPEFETVPNAVSNSPLSDTCLEIGVAFFQEYGPDICERLTSFLYDRDVNDLHFGNVGYIDGRIVLIDYAGYQDEEYSYDEEYDEDEE